MGGAAALRLSRFGVDGYHMTRRVAARDVGNTGPTRQVCGPLRSMVLKRLASAVMAPAAGGGNRQLELEFNEVCTPLVSSAGNVAIGDAVADANYHRHNVIRIIRIGKPPSESIAPPCVICL